MNIVKTDVTYFTQGMGKIRLVYEYSYFKKIDENHKNVSIKLFHDQTSNFECIYSTNEIYMDGFTRVDNVMNYCVKLAKKNIEMFRYIQYRLYY